MRATTKDRELEIARLRQQIISIEGKVRKRDRKIDDLEQKLARYASLKEKLRELKAANWALTIALDRERTNNYYQCQTLTPTPTLTPSASSNSQTGTT